jgi:hypothetical protein
MSLAGGRWGGEIRAIREIRGGFRLIEERCLFAEFAGERPRRAFRPYET